ncbi:MAG: phage regulatory CII family protein [Planctomycetota bacterium]|jgi:hypothetical protein
MSKQREDEKEQDAIEERYLALWQEFGRFERDLRSGGRISTSNGQRILELGNAAFAMLIQMLRRAEGKEPLEPDPLSADECAAFMRAKQSQGNRIPAVPNEPGPGPDEDSGGYRSVARRHLEDSG